MSKQGQWSPAYLDIWDEHEAFLMMLHVAFGDDFMGVMVGKATTDLYRFKVKLEDNGFEEAAKWLHRVYPILSFDHQNNPSLGSGIQKSNRYFYIPYNLQSSKEHTLSLTALNKTYIIN